MEVREGKGEAEEGEGRRKMEVGEGRGEEEGVKWRWRKMERRRQTESRRKVSAHTRVHTCVLVEDVNHPHVAVLLQALQALSRYVGCQLELAPGGMCEGCVRGV